MAFNLLRTGNADLDRVQQNVAKAFAAIGTTAQVVETVNKSTILSDATDVLLVNTQAGPATITLPATRKTQVIIIHSVGSNSLTLSGPLAFVRSDLPNGHTVTLMPIAGTYYPISRYPSAA